MGGLDVCGAEDVGLLRGFDAFGDDFEIGGVKEGGDAGEPIGGGVIGGDLVDEGFVEFDDVDIAAGEDGEIRTADAGDVVEGEAGALAPVVADGLDAEEVGDAALGDLEDDLGGEAEETGIAGGVLDAAAAEDLGRDIDAEVAIGMGAEPGLHLDADGVDDPIGDAAGHGGIVGEGDEVAGRDDAGGAAPADESLGSDAAAIGEGHGGHVLEEELAV